MDDLNVWKYQIIISCCTGLNTHCHPKGAAKIDKNPIMIVFLFIKKRKLQSVLDLLEKTKHPFYAVASKTAMFVAEYVLEKSKGCVDKTTHCLNHLVILNFGRNNFK